MKKVLVLAAVFTSVTALTVNAQDVKKEQQEKKDKTEQCEKKKECCDEKKTCCSQDSTCVAAKNVVKKDEKKKD